MNKRTKTIISTTIILVLVNTCIYNINTTKATDFTYSVTIDPSLSITLPTSTLTLDLNPVTQSFTTKDLNVTVATNNGNGYKLTMNTMSGSGGESGTSLVNINDATKTIGTLPIVIGTTSGSSITTYTEDTFPVNKWGYRISGNYLPYISGTTIALNDSPVANDTTTLTFASKIDYNQPAGLYAINLSFNGTINPTSPPYMQNLDPSLCVSDHPTLVVDSRDNRSYYIQRLADNKCWMIQNLRLGQDLDPVTGALVLTDQDTDISTTDAYNPRSEFILTNKVVDGVMPNKKVIDSDTSDEYNYIWDDSAFYCTNDYGCYYNVYTATAGVKSEGEDAVTTRNTDITSTICPKAWTLPTSGDHETTDFPIHSSDWRLLANAYGYNTSASTAATNMLVDPTNATENVNGASAPGLLLGGYYYGSGGRNITDYGYYWSRTICSMSRGYGIRIRTVGVVLDNNNRNNSRAVRCLLQE